jgi:hypothetical protein
MRIGPLPTWEMGIKYTAEQGRTFPVVGESWPFAVLPWVCGYPVNTPDLMHDEVGCRNAAGALGDEQGGAGWSCWSCATSLWNGGPYEVEP